MDKRNIRLMFSSCCAAIEGVADTRITSQDGQLEEVGMTLDDDSFITYCESEDAIHFYDNKMNLLLTVDSTSPLILMMQELITVNGEE